MKRLSIFLHIVWKSDVQFSPFWPKRCANCTLHTVNSHTAMYHRKLYFTNQFGELFCEIAVVVQISTDFVNETGRINHVWRENLMDKAKNMKYLTSIGPTIVWWVYKWAGHRWYEHCDMNYIYLTHGVPAYAFWWVKPSGIRQRKIIKEGSLWPNATLGACNPKIDFQLIKSMLRM